MRAAAVDAGRDPDAIEITRGGASHRHSVARMADEGCAQLVRDPTAFLRPGQAARSVPVRFADEVIAKVG